MKSTLENPLSFFDYYFDNGINKDVVDYKQTMEAVDNHISELSSEKTPLEYRYSSEPASYTMSLEEWISSAIKNEVKLSKEFIEQGFEKRFSNKKEVRAYADFLRLKCNELKNRKEYNVYPFLSSILERFLEQINQYSKDSKQYSFTPSFNLIADSTESKKKKIEKLYTLLTETPAIIESTEEEFTKAFNGEEIVVGIYWLVKARNKLTSKTSLFYFIEQLINNDYLSRSIISDLNKYVKYVFRDDLGKEFKNLKQSKSTVSQKVTSQDRIDTIISQL